MKSKGYRSIEETVGVNRRTFVRSALACSVATGGVILGVPPLFGQEKAPPKEPETNIGEFMKVTKTAHSLPGPFPGRVVQVKDARSLVDNKPDAKVIAEMFEKGVRTLTDKDLKSSFSLFFRPDDIVGLKVNPVGPPLISTRLEVVDAVIRWLVDNGLPKHNIVIWDRFGYMLKDAGFTPERYPGVQIEGLQTMDESGNTWRDAAGNHVSKDNFDLEHYYLAKGIEGKGVPGYTNDDFYLNQHVFNGEYSYFGKLITRKLTKIINIPVFKNTGNGISMATKNLGYAAVCNTGRLHGPLFFKVCTEVLAAPPVRDRLVLNVTDGLRAQYDGGPEPNAQFVYPHHSLYFATDPFALDMTCHSQLIEKRKASGIKVNEHPRYTDYLRYAEQLGLGIVTSEKIDFRRIEA